MIVMLKYLLYSCLSFVVYVWFDVWSTVIFLVWVLLDPIFRFINFGFSSNLRYLIALSLI